MREFVRKELFLQNVTKRQRELVYQQGKWCDKNFQYPFQGSATAPFTDVIIKWSDMLFIDYENQKQGACWNDNKDNKN